jgi:hypothetical protein
MTIYGLYKESLLIEEVSDEECHHKLAAHYYDVSAAVACVKRGMMVTTPFAIYCAKRSRLEQVKPPNKKGENHA